jgi:hypothetical protein
MIRPRLTLKRRFAKIVFLVVGAFSIIFFARPKAPEPIYAGKPVTQWLEDGYEPAAMALEEIGPTALPWVFRKLRHEHPRWDYWTPYLKLRQAISRPFNHLLPSPRLTGFDEERAANLLIGMGPPVLPALRAGLDDSNPTVRAACRLALKKEGLSPVSVP